MLHVCYVFELSIITELCNSLLIKFSWSHCKIHVCLISTEEINGLKCLLTGLFLTFCTVHFFIMLAKNIKHPDLSKNMFLVCVCLFIHSVCWQHLLRILLLYNKNFTFKMKIFCLKTKINWVNTVGLLNYGKNHSHNNFGLLKSWFIETIIGGWYTQSLIS